ncbi:hypothetical protein PIB30_075854, partial [Stylosanthes scabra]|nr:hypothetical protein [Stylosanthes scabra]
WRSWRRVRRCRDGGAWRRCGTNDSGTVTDLRGMMQTGTTISRICANKGMMMAGRRRQRLRRRLATDQREVVESFSLSLFRRLLDPG